MAYIDLNRLRKLPRVAQNLDEIEQAYRENELADAGYEPCQTCHGRLSIVMEGKREQCPSCLGTGWAEKANRQASLLSISDDISNLLQQGRFEGSFTREQDKAVEEMATAMAEQNDANADIYVDHLKSVSNGNPLVNKIIMMVKDWLQSIEPTQAGESDATIFNDDQQAMANLTYQNNKYRPVQAKMGQPNSRQAYWDKLSQALSGTRCQCRNHAGAPGKQCLNGAEPGATKCDGCENNGCMNGSARVSSVQQSDAVKEMIAAAMKKAY